MPWFDRITRSQSHRERDLLRSDELKMNTPDTRATLLEPAMQYSEAPSEVDIAKPGGIYSNVSSYAISPFAIRSWNQ